MKNAEQFLEIVRFLRTPLLDCSHPVDKTVSPKALRIRPDDLRIIKPSSVRTLCLSGWDNDEVLPLVWGVLADGGRVILDVPVHEDLRKRLRRECAFSLVTAGPFSVIRKFSGRAGERPVKDTGPKNGQPTVGIVRYGAIGDHIMATAVIEEFHRQGWHITYLCSERGKDVLGCDPRVDDLWVHESDILANDDSLANYWTDVSKRFDRWVNLTGVVEDGLLKSERKPEEFNWSWERRQAECSQNYIDAHLEKAGLDLRGVNPSILLTEDEKEWAAREIEKIRRQTKREKVVLYALSGSSFHKTYPWYGDVFSLFQADGDEVAFVTMGDKLETRLEVHRPNVVKRAGVYGIRQSIALCSVADAVFGPETGLVNAAGSFGVPTLCLLSHSSEENLTKYWKRDFSIGPNRVECPCHPCHQLHFSRNSCPRGKTEMGATLCMDRIDPVAVYERLKEALRGDDALTTS